jgi:regulator of sigma E protease
VEVLRFLGQLVTGRLPFTGLAGPVGLVNISVEVAEAGIVPLLLLLSFISVNLAILNFLPIPALDGGHMLFLAAEGVRGKPVDESLQIRLSILGIGFLVTLMFFVTVLDINRIFF